jgi:hypothetical protein
VAPISANGLAELWWQWLADGAAQAGDGGKFDQARLHLLLEPGVGDGGRLLARPRPGRALLM